MALSGHMSCCDPQTAPESARSRPYQRRRWRGRWTRLCTSAGRAVYERKWSSWGLELGPLFPDDGHLSILEHLDEHERSGFRFRGASSSTPTRMVSDVISPSRKSWICVRWSASFLPGVLLQRIHDQFHWVCSTECSNRGVSRPVREPTDHVRPRGTTATNGGFVWSPFAVILTWLRTKIMTCRHRTATTTSWTGHTCTRSSRGCTPRDGRRPGRAAPPSWKPAQRASTGEAAQNHRRHSSGWWATPSFLFHQRSFCCSCELAGNF